jgi:hypothetical protein
VKDLGAVNSVLAIMAVAQLLRLLPYIRYMPEFPISKAIMPNGEQMTQSSSKRYLGLVLLLCPISTSTVALSQILSIRGPTRLLEYEAHSFVLGILGLAIAHMAIQTDRWLVVKFQEVNINRKIEIKEVTSELKGLELNWNKVLKESTEVKTNLDDMKKEVSDLKQSIKRAKQDMTSSKRQQTRDATKSMDMRLQMNNLKMEIKKLKNKNQKNKKKISEEEKNLLKLNKVHHNVIQKSAKLVEKRKLLVENNIAKDTQNKKHQKRARKSAKTNSNLANNDYGKV